MKGRANTCTVNDLWTRGEEAKVLQKRRAARQGVVPFPVHGVGRSVKFGRWLMMPVATLWLLPDHPIFVKWEHRKAERTALGTCLHVVPEAEGPLETL